MSQWTREKIDEMYAAIQRGDEMGIKPCMPHNTDKRLKPCPFCGSDHVDIEFIEKTNMFSVKCFGCGISACCHFKITKVYSQWNTRAGEK